MLERIYWFYPSFDGIYVCVVWNFVDCRNTVVYNNEARDYNQEEFKHQENRKL